MYLYPRAVYVSPLSTYLNNFLESENMQWKSDKLQEVLGPNQNIPFFFQSDQSGHCKSCDLRHCFRTKKLARKPTFSFSFNRTITLCLFFLLQEYVPSQPGRSLLQTGMKSHLCALCPGPWSYLLLWGMDYHFIPQDWRLQEALQTYSAL